MKAHAEQMSDGMDLINATGTKAPDIEFLERDQAPQKTAFDPKRSVSCLGQTEMCRRVGTGPAVRRFDYRRGVQTEYRKVK